MEPPTNGEHVLEIREPGEFARRVTLTAGATRVGREGPDLVLSDAGVSRHHFRLVANGPTLTVTDLGSTNGTYVNGQAVTEGTIVRPGDTIEVSDTTILVVATEQADPVPTPEPEPEPPAPEPVAPEPVAPGPVVAAAPAATATVEGLAVRETDAATFHFRPGTAGEAAVADVAAAFRRARRRLAGLGSEPSGIRPQVLLVDPFPDPDRPGEVVTGGTTVDPSRGQIWMVVTSESPPEAPERALALFFGAALPAADDLGVLLEGYGLHLGEAPDPDDGLRQLGDELPPLGRAEGEVGAAMALSFVRHLVERGGDATFRRLLAEAEPGRVDALARDLFGTGLSSLEEGWREQLQAGPPEIRTGQFLRLTARYVRPYAWRQAELFVYMVLGLTFTLVFPFAFRHLLDRAIPSGELTSVVRVLGLLGGAFLVTLVAGVRRAYVSAVVSSSVVQRIRTEMFDRLQSLSAAWFARQQAGDIVARLFGDVQALEVGLSATLRDGLFQIVSLVVSCGILLVLNPLLAMIVIVGAPLVAVVFRAMGTGAQKRSMAVQEQMGGLMSLASENMGAQPVIKAFALEARERARFGTAAHRLVGSQVRMEMFGGLFGLSVTAIVISLRLAVLGLGGWLILKGDLTVGGLVAFMGVMGEVLGPVTVLTQIGQQVQAAGGALTRINEVLEAEPDIADVTGATPLPPLAEEIRLDAVQFSYTPERRTLQGIDAVIRAGSRVAFVGPTGAGKSSVLQLLMRSYDPDEGAVRFDGRDVRTATLESLRAQMGVVFQETFLFDTTLGDNIAMGKPGATQEEVEAAARAAELHDFIGELPRGYDTLVGERGSRLSGGQRQRLAIARALVRNPRVLVLDEATSALDPRTERLIAATLQRVAEGRTTIAVTHRLASVVDYDRIFVIVAGRIAEQGRHEDLLAAGGAYADLWSEQTGGAGTAEAPFDAAGALARVPLFSDLGPEQRAEVASRLRAVELAAGESVGEGGRLLLVRAGRARMLVPGRTGGLVPVADLVQGDSFGVSALLGQETGAVLHALDGVTLLVLDDVALAGLAATLPTVAAALEGSRPAVAPAGGRRLSRLTAGAAMRLSAIPVAPAVDPR